jgi:hypothetical protein
VSGLKHIDKNGFKYTVGGKGKPIIVLHGLMGGLGNFKDFFRKVSEFRLSSIHA